ncbi:MAG: hypothetical protein JSS62_01635 [Verrucomicrobia bacterium]|nr:hypothetical protein [Verrucomicrobiota bacterium]MBS1947619.1 hypothetical protein [Bacteroidota bacterium]MBS1973447.1 hypothetical protein [Bacteroidota bacterium]
MERQFSEIISLIKAARYNAFKAVNTELINLYWEIGKYISHRTEKEGWGKSTVKQLADFIQNKEPELKGFSDKNLWRMKQFYEVYRENPKLATLWRVEYAMSRNMSPTLISQYTIALPDKKILQAKLHDLYELYAPKTNEE